MTESNLLVEAGRITTLTLDRPDKHNALDTAMGDALVAAVRAAGLDPAVKAVVIRGAGKSFCSGDDLSEAELYHNMDIEPIGVVRHPYFQLMNHIRRIPKPVIVQVHGYCLGSAMDIMLAADFAIAARDAKMRMVFGAAGITTGTAFLPKYVGMKRANRLLFDPGFLDPEEALRLGLLTDVVDPDQVEKAVDALAETIAGLGDQYHGQFGLVKDLINRQLFPSIEEDVHMQGVMTRLNDLYRLSHAAR